jgi:hydrogenase-4 component B
MMEFWPLYLIMFSSALAAVSGLPLMFRLTDPAKGQRMAAGFMAASAATGIMCALVVLFRRLSVTHELGWTVPYGPMTCSIDPLSAFFLLPILTVSTCCSFYALGYWPAEKKQRNIGRLSFFFGLLVAGLIWVVLARSAVLFLFAWEIMAISAFFILTPEDNDEEVRKSGILYMICTHISTLSLFALFILLKTTTGTFAFPAAGSISAATPFANVLFLIALFGFGIKAGMMPFHVWLPSAHANAPSHVSAVMSGVILKIGIYGLLRTLSFFDAIPLWWGITVLTTGVISGVLGVVFAIGQHDLKRLLAYHSIENIGIILMGAGVGLIGFSTGNPQLVVLGMAGALLHVLNHAVFKSLLFLGAGSVIHSLGTREIDRMGGLLKNMPWTALLFLTGAIAICGLPPLNGFISEMFIYLGLFKSVITGSGAAAASCALAAPALALIGGLALACFVKVFGVVFLGVSRSPVNHEPHEATRSMLVPMAVLGTICVLIGVVPVAVAPLLESAVASLSSIFLNDSELTAMAPLGWVSVLSMTLAAIVFILFTVRIKNVTATKSMTWGCGYLAPTPRMQYTASSFADTLTGLFRSILRPDVHIPHIRSSFPAPSKFSSHVPETVLEIIYIPLFSRVNDRLAFIRKLQNGKMHYYIFYMFLTLIVLLMIPY